MATPIPDPLPELSLSEITRGTLRALRADRRLTQTDLAVRTGINQTKISLIERERAGASPAEWAKLLGALTTE
jgi:transcriptional regulator with XRE-family HTH domain